MYLVELRPGKEELYRTGDELAAAIRSGEVDGHSRIYHRSTSKWISITLHPQYKAIVERSVQPPAPTQPDRNSWTYLTAQAETLEGGEAEPEASLPERRPDSDAGDGQADGDGGDSPWRRPVTLGISGLFLVFGIQLAFSGPRPSWSARVAARPAAAAVIPAAAEAASPSQVVSLASTTAGWSEPDGYVEESITEEAPGLAEKPAAVLPKAPRLTAKSLDTAIPVAPAGRDVDGKTVDALLVEYGKAYEGARARLGSGLRVARLNQLLASSRLSPDGGITDTRLGLAGFANIVRVYREQESAIEREFQDSFTTRSREHGWSAKTAKQWYSREGGKDSPELVALTDRLIGVIDSVLAVVSAEAGAYKVADDKIRFEDVNASRGYGELRRKLNAAVDSARIAGGEGSAGPVGHLLRAIGTSRLPQES